MEKNSYHSRRISLRAIGKPKDIHYKRRKRSRIQYSEGLPEISRDENKNAVGNMKNGKIP